MMFAENTYSYAVIDKLWKEVEDDRKRAKEDRKRAIAREDEIIRVEHINAVEIRNDFSNEKECVDKKIKDITDDLFKLNKNINNIEDIFKKQISSIKEFQVNLDEKDEKIIKSLGAYNEILREMKESIVCIIKESIFEDLNKIVNETVDEKLRKEKEKNLSLSDNSTSTTSLLQ